MPKKSSRKPAARTIAAPPAEHVVAQPRLFVAAIAVLVLAGTVVRVLAARGELWLDEIWSFRLVHLLTGPAGVFTSLHHDNNHHLNSLYLYFVNESQEWIRYRLHALAAGVATIVLAATVARREGGREPALAAALLLGGSFLMVLYASEARGYALAVCLSFSAVLLAARFLETGRWWWAAGYGAAATLGILSHLTFLHALFGLIVWTAYRARRQPRLRNPWLALAALHGFPLAALAALFWTNLRHMIVGGGPMIPASDIVVRALSLTVGGPEGGPWLGLAAMAAATAWIVSMALIRRSGSDLWILIAATAVGGPAITLLTLESNLLYERYFLVAAAFVTLSYSWLLTAAARRSRSRSRWLALTLAVAFLLPNAGRIMRLVEVGRGSYLPAMRHMTSLATQRPVTVGSDHEFRQGRVVEFYQPFLPGDVVLEYHTSAEWAPAGPEWMLVHSQEPQFTPAADLTVVGGRHYRLSAFYPYAGVSGWHLAVYHNALAIRR